MFLIEKVYIMIPIAFARSQAAQEIEETIQYAGLTDAPLLTRLREKINDKKVFYKIPFKYGIVKVYSHRYILVNKEKYTSVTAARRGLGEFIN
jgi:hypothetical protein